MTDPPWLEADDLRVDLAGAVVLSGATFATSARSVLAVGEDGALVEALTGRARIRSGRLSILGRDVSRREHARAPRAVGIALLDPPWFEDWTALECLIAGARLGSLSRPEARRASEKALAQLEIGLLAPRRVRTLGRAERRLLSLAQAIVADPELLVLPAPFRDLSQAEASFIGRAVTAAAAGRRCLVTATALPPGSEERALAARSDEVLVFASGRLLRRGRLGDLESGVREYSLLLRGDVQALASAVEARGGRLEGGPVRYIALVPPNLSATDLLSMSLSARVPVLGLAPRVVDAGPTVVEVEP